MAMALLTDTHTHTALAPFVVSTGKLSLRAGLPQASKFRDPVTAATLSPRVRKHLQRIDIDFNVCGTSRSRLPHQYAVISITPGFRGPRIALRLAARPSHRHVSGKRRTRLESVPDDNCSEKELAVADVPMICGEGPTKATIAASHGSDSVAEGRLVPVDLAAAGCIGHGVVPDVRRQSQGNGPGHAVASLPALEHALVEDCTCRCILD